MTEGSASQRSELLKKKELGGRCDFRDVKLREKKMGGRKNRHLGVGWVGGGGVVGRGGFGGGWRCTHGGRVARVGLSGRRGRDVDCSLS